MTKSIYLYCNHRYDLIFFVRLKEFLVNKGIDYNYEILINNELYSIPRVSDFIQKYFDSVKILPITSKMHSHFFLRFKEWFYFKYWIRYELDQSAFVILIDKSSLISRVVLKQHKKNILIQLVEYIDNSYTFSIKYFLLDGMRSIFSGALIMKHYKIIASSAHVRLLSFFSFNRPKNIYFYTKNKISNPSLNLPCINISKTTKKIVIFGSRFLTWTHHSVFSKEIFIQKIRSIYMYIYDQMGADCKIFYIPHPFEKNREFNMVNEIFSNKLFLIKNYFSSEHFLFENRDIYMTFSLGSTSSHSSFSMGFNSKVFYKMLGLKPEIEQVYDQIFYDLPKSFFAHSFKDLLIPCKSKFKSGRMDDFIALLNKYD